MAAWCEWNTSTPRRCTPGDSLVLAPGGTHVMLMNLAHLPTAGRARLRSYARCLRAPVSVTVMTAGALRTATHHDGEAGGDELVVLGDEYAVELGVARLPRRVAHRVPAGRALLPAAGSGRSRPTPVSTGAGAGCSPSSWASSWSGARSTGPSGRSAADTWPACTRCSGSC